jgi:hypothetical protein
MAVWVAVPESWSSLVAHDESEASVASAARRWELAARDAQTFALEQRARQAVEDTLLARDHSRTTLRDARDRLGRTRALVSEVPEVTARARDLVARSRDLLRRFPTSSD